MSLHSNKFLFAGIFISCSVFVSCKKDHDPQSLQSGKYNSDKVGDLGSVRMFTKSGEIKDQNLINTYKARFGTLLDPVKASSSISDSFFVMDENNVKIAGRELEVTRMDNYYQFRSKDTLNSLGQLDSVVYNVVKYKPYFNSIPIVTAGGYSYLNRTFQYYYASTNSSGLAFPMITAIHFSNVQVSGNVYYGNISAYRLNNVNNDKFPTNTLKDTLLVQTFNVYYKK
jgi:hypothetical protein